MEQEHFQQNSLTFIIGTDIIRIYYDKYKGFLTQDILEFVAKKKVIQNKKGLMRWLMPRLDVNTHLVLNHHKLNDEQQSILNYLLKITEVDKSTISKWIDLFMSL